MTVLYQETAANRVVAVVDTIGDTTPFIETGRDRKNADVPHVKSSNITKHRMRLFIRPVIKGDLMETADRHGVKVAGPWAAASGIPIPNEDDVVYKVNKRIEIVTSGVIAAGFQLLYKRDKFQTDREAVVAADYRAAQYAGTPGFSDETDWQTGEGLFAIRMSDHTSGTYALELVLDEVV